MNNSPVILKFGGAALNGPEGFARFESILREYAGRKTLIVISAFSKSTRRLARAARFAESGELDSALDLACGIVSSHRDFARALISPGTEFDRLMSDIDSAADRLNRFLRGIYITRELTARTLDSVLSFGELFALRIIDVFLDRCGIGHRTIDAAELIVTDSSHGRAEPITDLCRDNVYRSLMPAFDYSDLVITQGFVARSADGEITTMGIESSNLTAILLADLTGAGRVSFLTDVDGIMTADPLYINDAVNIPHMDYLTAHLAALAGLKLIYPPMIEIAARNNIEFEFRNAFSDGPSTIVSAGAGEIQRPMVIIRRDLCCRKYRFDKSSQLKSAINMFADQIPDMFSMNIIQPEIAITAPCGRMSNLNISHADLSAELNSLNAISVIFPNEFICNNYAGKLVADMAPRAVMTESAGRVLRFFTIEDPAAMASEIHSRIV